MEFTSIQLEYLKRIKNPELKKLVEQTNALYLMTKDEKTDFLIKASLVHLQPELETKLLATLNKEEQFSEKIIKSPGFEAENAKMKKVMADNEAEIKQGIKKIKTTLRHEKEETVKQNEDHEINNLENKLSNLI